MYQTDYFPGTENELVDAMGRKVGEKDYAPNMNYSENAYDSLGTEEEKKGFLSKMMSSFRQKTSNLPSWAKSAMTAAGMLNPLTAIPSLISQFGSGEGGGPSYGIAGLSDQQKAMYDSLAGAGLLYDGPGGMKTYDGKNFSRISQKTVDDYFSSKKNITRGDTKIKTLKDYEAYIADKPNLLKTYKQYQLLDGTLDTFDKNEQIRAEQKQKIRNAEIARKMRLGDPKNNPFSDEYSGKKGSPNYTPRGPNENTVTATTTNNNKNDNNQGGGNTPQYDSDDTNRESRRGGNNNQNSSSVSNQESQENAAYDFARGGRAGYFFGGRVNYKTGGRIGFQGGGSDASLDDFGTSTSAPGPGDTGGEGGNKPSDDSGSQFDGGNNNGASDNPPVSVVNNNPVDISTITKSVGNYKIPYGVEALMADKGRLQAVLNANNVLDKNLGAEFTYDKGPFSIGAYADMDGDKSIEANYINNAGSKYSFGLNKDGGQLKFAKAFANGGLASIF